MATLAPSPSPIFRGSAFGKLPSRNPANDGSSSAPDTSAKVSVDVKLAAILDAPLAPGETAFEGYRNKELQLVAAMSQLSILDARALHARLANPLGTDALAAKFMRLTIERRVRLLNFLADARRRAALAGK